MTGIFAHKNMNNKKQRTTNKEQQTTMHTPYKSPSSWYHAQK